MLYLISYVLYLVSTVLIGVACGIGAGVLVGIIYWVIYTQWKKRHRNTKQTKRRKTYEEVKQSLIIKQDSIPPFNIPCIPIRVQEPLEHSTSNSDISPIKSPLLKDFRQGRRGSVPLDQLCTQSAQVRRKLSPASPPSIFAVNERAIKNLTTSDKRKNRFAARSSTSPLGKLDISLFYDQDFQNLQIRINRGTQVYPPGSIEDLTELVVSIAVVYDGKQIFHDITKPVEASANPDFNQQLTVKGLTSNQMRVGTLKLTLKNNNTDSPISVAYYPLSSVPYNLFTNETVRLNEVEEIDEVGFWRQVWVESCNLNVHPFIHHHSYASIFFSCVQFLFSIDNYANKCHPLWLVY